MTHITLTHRFISALLVLLVILSMIPISALAADETEPALPEAETEPAAEESAAPETEPPNESSETTEPAEETAETTEPVETEPTESTEKTEPVDEVIRVTPLNLYDDGMMPFARYQLTKWGSYQIFPHTPVYIEWTFPDGSKPYLNGYSGYGDATFNYPHYMEINGDPAYCIFPGVDAENLTYTDEQALDTWENGFSEAQRQAIGLIVALGYGACDFTADSNDNMASTYNWDEAKTIQVQKYMATQILIWEIIVQDRSAAYPYTLNNSRLWDSFYKANDNWYKWPTMLKVRNEIIAKMQASTTIPSFASNSATTAPEIKLTYNASTKLYEATVTDANKVLANYNFSSSVSGITFTRNGNTLKITATREAAATIMKSDAVASATGPSVTANPDKEAIVWSAAYGQPVVTPAPTTPVKAYISLAVEDSSTMTMSKTSPNGDVEGYCFKIYQWGSGSWYGKSDASGKIYVTDENYTASSKTYTFEGLTDGEYTFLEVLSKHGAGSVFPNSWKITVTDADGKTVFNKTFTGEIARDSNGDARLGVTDAKIAITGLSGGGHMTMIINNAPENGDLEIVKTSSSGNVSGFNFKVEGNGISKTVTSDEDGRIKVEGLKEGTYTVTEVLPKDSPYYCTTDNPQTVSVKSGKTATVTFDNELKKWRVTVTKKDAKTGEAQADATLDGAVYGLYKDGKLLKQYTVKNGTFTTDEYLCGTGYTLKEISAPPGYQLDTTVYNLDRYSGAGNCTDPLTTSQVSVLEDVITAYFQITKRTLNPVTGKTAPESGAVFRYYLKSEGSYNACPNDLKGTMTTGADGIAKSKALPYGTYVVEQTAGAEGTDFVASFEVMVSEQGKTYTYTKDNPYWTGTVSIVKCEEGTTTPLTAKFNLLDEDETVLETDTTDADGNLAFQTKLIYGQVYYVQEAEAPEGYELDDSLHPITVTERNQKIVLTLENAPQEGSITVRKVDPTGKAMSGIKFRLEYSTDGKSWSPVTYREKGTPVIIGGCTSQNLTDGALTTGSNGVAAFTGLRISGQTGKVFYRLTECSTADGSTMLVEPAFEGELPMNDSKDISITAVNSDVFELPHTGSNGMTTVPFGILLAGIALSAVFFHARRIRKKEA